MTAPAAGQGTAAAATDGMAALTALVQDRLLGRVRNFHLVRADAGLVLRGQARTYYAKQLALKAVAEATCLPIAGNHIEVF